MDKSFQIALGIALLVAGATLLLFFRDTELGWFRGQPLGMVLVVLGVVDLIEARPKRR